MIIRSLLNCSSLLARNVIATSLVAKVRPTIVNVNLCKNVLSVESVRYKLRTEKRDTQYYKEFRSTWLTRITPDDCTPREGRKILGFLRSARVEGRSRRRNKRRSPIDYKPQMKGIVLKTVIKKPKKPNSANRKCVFIRLSNGKEATAHIPGEGHNLQEHSMVLVQMKRTKDVPGLRLKCIRGAYDLGHVYKPK